MTTDLLDHDCDAAVDPTQVRLRPLSRGDRQTVLTVFEGMSAQSRYFRFLAPMPRLPDFALRHLADIDHQRHVALVAELDGRPVAIGRYFRDVDKPAVAEVALALTDAFQGHGIGTRLLAGLGAVGAAYGVERFTYLTLPQNRACIALLQSAAASLRRDGNALAGEGPLGTAQLTDAEARRLICLVRAEQLAA